VGKQPSNRKEAANHEKIAGDEFFALGKFGLSLTETMTVLEISRHGFLIGFHGSQGIEQFHQARLVRITQRRLAIWLDPFGMLDAKIVVDLSQ
jgi:hypothetical protein